MNFILGLVKIISVILVIYYGVKLLRSKNKRRQGIKKNFLTSLFVFLLLLLVSGKPSEAKSSTTATDNVKVVKKYIGKDKYKLAKEENTALLAKKAKLVKQADKSQDKKDELVEKKNKEKADAEREQAKQKEEQEQAQKQSEKQAQEDAKKQEQAQTQQATPSSNTGAKGDMNTSSSGQIVGNKNSHIYHVPGQRGYNMNSSNAVYFQSEQEAIAAGYRKAKV